MEKNTWDNLPDIILPEDAAAYLRVGRNTMYNLLRSGEIPSLRLGHQYRIPKKYLQEYLDRKWYNTNMGDSPDQ